VGVTSVPASTIPRLMTRSREAENARTLDRRHLVTGALGAGAGLALAGAPFALATEPGDATKTVKRPAATFFHEPALNFELLFLLGAAGYGAAESGEVLSTFDRIHAKGDKLHVVFEEFRRLGRRARSRADRERQAGRLASARSSYLRSAMYLDVALFYTLASGQPTRRHEGQAYSEMEASWARAAALFEPAFQPIKIPYQGSYLPGWFLSPGGKGRRPTAILNNGSDAQNVDMFVYGGAAALERGWNALIFEGPGQGGNLFLRNMPFVPDWETVVTPVVDYLRGRPEVDNSRICLAGQSFGGYLTARAAAYEHRIAGLVPDPGVVDCFATWSRDLGPLLGLLNSGKGDEFNHEWDGFLRGAGEFKRFGIEKRIEIYGNGNGYEQLQAAQKYVLSPEDARRITTPTAILSPELEQFFPGQAQTLHKWMRAKNEIIRFTVAEGAEYHCEPMAPQLRNERVFDWLETNLQPVR
jgi:hypothetical protein